MLDRADGALAPAAELERGGYVLWDSRTAGNGARAGAGAGGADADKADADKADADGAGSDGKAAAGRLDAILIATGAEVTPTLEAARALAAEGTHARVVSMPCMELFEAQPPEYRDAVLPPETEARLAVEPGASQSWWRWVGTHGDVLGIDRFGASAPGARVLQELGFTADNIAVRARALLKEN